MQNNIRYIIFGLAAVLVFALFVVGTVFPYQKSKAYIDALKISRSASSLSDFFEPYQVALDTSSPLGQRELVRNFASTVSGVVQKSGEEDPRVAHTVLRLLDLYSSPLVEDPSISDSQLLIAVSSAYMRGYLVTDDTTYRERALLLYKKGHDISPNRPQFLYALFDDAVREQNVTDVRLYGEEIVRLWPDDPRVPGVLEQLGQ